MEGEIKLRQSEYETYIIRNVLHETYSKDFHPEVTKPVLRLKNDGGYGSHYFGLSWVPVTEPFEMASETHAHDFDQFLIFIGGDLTNMLDLGGEVELTLGEEGKELEKFVFTTATMVYIPKGTLHCPLNFKRVNDPGKPILFQNFFLTPEYKKTDKKI